MKVKIESSKELLLKREWAAKKIKGLIGSSIIRGSIREHGNICGTPGCRCKRKKNPILHGPYKYLSFRGSRSNHSIMISGGREEKVEESINNYKKIMEAIKTISDIDFNTVRYYHRDEGGK